MDQNMRNKKKQKRSRTLIQLNREDYPSGSGESTFRTSALPVDLMTSRELQYDINARIGTVKRILKDTVRIDNFKEAILHNKHLFKGKRVLNVGCGIGVYALLAAKAQAAKVYAVDDSNVIYYTQQIVEANGYSKIIEVIKGKITEIELPISEVDIIVSDWMGSALLYESCCQDVIFARDKWLKAGGLIFPDEAKLFVVAFEDPLIKNRNIDWWRRVYGFDMGCLREAALKEPRIHTLKPEQVLSKQFQIKSLNLNTATLEDLKVRSKFMLPIIKAGHMHGIALYFHIYFTKAHVPFGFSTDPWSLPTGWMQTKLFFDDSLVVSNESFYYGGIEFHPAKSPSDFCNMVLNLEMFKGEPTAIEEEVLMTWHFKLDADIISNSEETNKTFSTDVYNFNHLITDKNMSTENCTDDLSKLKIDCDTQTMCLDKPKVSDSYKFRQITLKRNSQIFPQKTFTQNTKIDLKNNEVINKCNNNSSLKKKHFKQHDIDGNMILKKSSKIVKNNFDPQGKVTAQISAESQTNNALNNAVTIGDYNYPCQKSKRNKCKLKKK